MAVHVIPAGHVESFMIDNPGPVVFYRPQGKIPFHRAYYHATTVYFVSDDTTDNGGRRTWTANHKESVRVEVIESVDTSIPY